ncbi:unnamed protein product [Phytophthora fragariaefolia]|uniref:Unnamed protein product n=1 Tax=Phytophthora fragariaefolia TaxID=1490495 RepID=A0A9W6XR31_9STRA|nr:unnamed protein product [Phytophthora fragariaefolia]
MVLLRPEPTPEELNPSAVMDEDVLEHKVLCHKSMPLPREQCDVIDAFFAAKAKAGMVRESKSPHSSPTFCVRKPNGKWRLVHAYNKLNSATVPAQTPIPRKDVLLNNMAGCTLYSALDLVGGYFQILMRESDIPLTAVSTPGGMLWEWLVMPQGLSNAQPLLIAWSHNCLDHCVRSHILFEAMRANKLFANIDKCVFGAEEIKVLGGFVSSVGVRADPEKVKAIAALPTPRSQKDLRKWLGLANYLHKYSAEYAGLAKPLSDLLKKDTDWRWERQHQEAYDSIKSSLQRAPILALPDDSKPFSVVCDASDYAISCSLLQSDEDGHERVISFQSWQLKAAERNYPVHDKELLAMNFASLARFFAAGEDAKVKWLSPRQRSRFHRFEWADGMLHYRVEPGDPPRVVDPNDEDRKFYILQEAHDAPYGGHLGR